MGEAGKTFGTCCERLKEALEASEFEPMITVASNEIFYLCIGLLNQEEAGPALVDHPLFFCPFCGTKLQTEESQSQDRG
jgi:hypothetical protein